MKKTMSPFVPRRLQQGVVLLEALIAILIFSFGILSIMGLQAVSINSVRDMKYRTDAAFLANQIIGQMWTDWSNLNQYGLNTSGSNCSFSGGSAATGGSQAATNVTGWQTQVSALLPGATTAQQRITIGAGNLVTVIVCWQAPQDATWHSHTVTAQVQGPST